jgi:prolipoprotein diacylglyceryltransferase
MPTGQWLALCAAFWVAVFGFLRRAPEARHGLRFSVGLALGAVLAHLGWAALHWPSVRHEPWAVVDLGAGFSVLFVPLGLLATAPWRAGAATRDGYLGAALGCLPLAQAVARLGCLAAGCCLGGPTELPWGVASPGEGGSRHPVAFYEVAGLLALHVRLRGAARERVAGPALAGLGAVRLALEPWRATPPLGSPSIPPWALAASWIAVGLALHRIGRSAG